LLIKNKNIVFSLIILTLILSLSFKVNQARSLSLHFVDEEDHISVAYYITQGYQLHENLQNNHQPPVYFASATLQKLLKPPNIFMLIKRHRQMMFAYGAIWSLLMVLRFRIVGLCFVFFFEFLKYFLFGNVNLMETWAVYPSVYLMGDLFEVWIKNRLPNVLESIFLGLCNFLIIFNMIPLWPWLVVVWLGYLVKAKKSLVVQAISVLGCMTILFNLLFPYSIVDWFRETVVNNFLYAIPQLSPYKSSLDWLRMVFFPFLAILTKSSLQAKFIVLFITGWLISFICLLKKKANKAWIFGVMYFLLLVANNRVLSPGDVYYHGFHLLPWMGMIIFIFVFSVSYLFTKKSETKKYLLPVFVMWSLLLMANKNMPYFQLKTDIEHEYYVNYSTLDDMNFAIKNLVNDGDRLAVTANEPILYWNTGAELATRQLVYGGWEPKVKELNDTYHRVFFGDDPPEIIYGGDEPELLTKKYTNILRHDKPTELFVRNDKYIVIRNDQWQALKSRGFGKNKTAQENAYP